MCGINGLVNGQGAFIRDPASAVTTMNQVISHRGPDHCAVWSDAAVTLGHCRLSIQDLSAAADQPFVKDDYVLIYNGEIYNFRQLRAQLSGVTFSSDSDTEVLLELWRRYGEQSLPMLRGMFVFAIYQRSTGQLVLARDPFGIKPLYYLQHAGMLAFSSELKALETLGVPLETDPGVIAESLLLCWIRDSQCIYRNVQKLQPGHLLILDSNGQVQIRQYFDPTTLLQKPPVQATTQGWIDGLDAVLTDAVAQHLVADVPVSAFLSGGLDSSLLVAMASRKVPNLSCYTIKFSDTDQRIEKMADDHYYATKVSAVLKTPLHTIEVKPDLAGLLAHVVHHLDEPIGDSAAINTYLICQAAHQAGVKVLLSGMGADEIFGGYRKHLANLYAQRYQQLPGWIRQITGKVVQQLPTAGDESGYRTIRWAKRFLSFAELSPADAFLRSYSYYDLQELIQACEAPVTTHLQALAAEHQTCYEMASARRGALDAMCYTDITHFMVGLNLHYTDRASMAYSAEVRVPFIDKEVIAYGFSLPPALKIHGSQQKYLLKKLAERYLPSEIIYRPKSPFTLPLRAWIRHELSALVAEFLLSEQGLLGRKLFKPAFLHKLVADEFSGQHDRAQQIWHLLTLEQWLRNKESRPSQCNHQHRKQN